jgi:hypothetical protein
MALRVEFEAAVRVEHGISPHIRPESIEDLLARQYGVIARWQAGELNLSDEFVEWQIVTGRWRTAHRGIWVDVAAERQPFTPLLAAVAAAGRAACVSGLSAAFLHGLAGGRALPVMLAVPRPRRVRVPGLVVHQVGGLPTAHGDDGEQYGIPVLDPLWTLLTSCGALGARRPAQRMFDDGLRKGLYSIRAVDEFLATIAPNRPGAPLLRACRADAVPYSESPAEALAIRVYRLYQVPEPVGPILLRDGPVTRRVDYGWPRYGALLEIDGRRFHTLTSDTDRDARKEHLMEAAGAEWIRTTWAELTERPEQFARRTCAVLGVPFLGRRTRAPAGI